MGVFFFARALALVGLPTHFFSPLKSEIENFAFCVVTALAQSSNSMEPPINAFHILVSRDDLEEVDVVLDGYETIALRARAKPRRSGNNYGPLRLLAGYSEIHAIGNCALRGRGAVHGLNYLRSGPTGRLFSLVLQPRTTDTFDVGESHDTRVCGINNLIDRDHAAVVAPLAGILYKLDGEGHHSGLSAATAVVQRPMRALRCRGSALLRALRDGSSELDHCSLVHAGWSPSLFSLRGGRLQRFRCTERTLPALLRDDGSTEQQQPQPRADIPLSEIEGITLRSLSSVLRPSSSSSSHEPSVRGASSDGLLWGGASPPVIVLKLCDGSCRHLLPLTKLACWRWFTALAVATGCNVTPAARARLLIQASLDALSHGAVTATTTRPAAANSAGSSGGFSGSSESGITGSHPLTQPVPSPSTLAGAESQLQDVDVASIITSMAASEAAAQARELINMASEDAYADAVEHGSLLRAERQSRVDQRTLDVDLVQLIRQQEQLMARKGTYRAGTFQ